MNKCLNCGAECEEEMLCTTCEDNRYFVCGDCGKAHNAHAYCETGSPLCEECHNKQKANKAA